METTAGSALKWFFSRKSRRGCWRCFCKYFLIGNGQNADLNGKGQDDSNTEKKCADAANDAGNRRQAEKRPEIGLDRLDALLRRRPEIHLFVDNKVETEHQEGLGAIDKK